MVSRVMTLAIDPDMKNSSVDCVCEIEKAEAFGRTVTVKVKFADFRKITRSRSFPAVIGRQDLLRQASLDLVRALLPLAKGVRLLGVTVSNFDQGLMSDGLPLFDSRDPPSPDPLPQGEPSL